jgi:LysR family glycine cleavage system transcriptional activator
MLNSSGGRKLVHLNALRAFEAAARHSSFVCAADELNVTPSAISQQIRTLEEYLETPLFIRSKVGVSLSAPAREAYADIRDGLQHLAAGLAKLRSQGGDRLITMTVPPSFAAKWLLPRIEQFREQHPDLDIRLDTSDRLADFGTEGIDIGVRYGLGGYAGLESEKLFDEEVFPVCSPALLPRAPLRPNAEWLASMILIHDTTSDFDPSFPTWRTWLMARGMRGVDTTRSLRLNSSLLATQAAIDGHGVALARAVIADADIRAGRLVKLFETVDGTKCAYYVVYRKDESNEPKIKQVRNWLLEQAAH